MGLTMRVIMRAHQVRQLEAARSDRARDPCGPGTHCLGLGRRAEAREQIERRVGDRVSIFRPFPVLDADHHPGRVDIADAQVEHFVEPQAGGVGGEQRRAMFPIGGLREHPLDLLAAQDHGEAHRLARPGNIERRPIALQGRAIEKVCSTRLSATVTVVVSGKSLLPPKSVGYQNCSRRKLW